MEIVMIALVIAVPSFIGFVIWLIVSQLRGGFKKYNSMPTFTEYRNTHPNLVDNGRVICRECAGSQIYVRHVGNVGSKLLNFHVCRTCGTALYRSEA
jgi:hypothetical protein